jgi:hypothetical protein
VVGVDERDDGDAGRQFLGRRVERDDLEALAEFGAVAEKGENLLLRNDDIA